MRYEDLDTCTDLEQYVELIPVEEAASASPVAQTGIWTIGLRATSVLACAALMSMLPVESVESTRGPATAVAVSRLAQAPPRLAQAHLRAATAARQLLVVVPDEPDVDSDPDHGF